MGLGEERVGSGEERVDSGEEPKTKGPAAPGRLEKVLSSLLRAKFDHRASTLFLIPRLKWTTLSQAFVTPASKNSTKVKSLESTVPGQPVT